MHASYRRLIAAHVVTAGILVAFTSSAHAQTFAERRKSQVDYSVADAEPRLTCEALQTSFKDNELASLTTRAMPASDGVPAHCRVSGVLKPEIGFEVNLPATWNHRMYMIGNGGLAGEQPDDPRRAAQRAAALANAFVMVSTDTGHNATKEPQGAFAQRNPATAVDYAYRAVHLTATTAKKIADAYYGKRVTRAYWDSCSNGGRQGLIEAQRFPDDFDGIVANAPWVDQTGFTIDALWNQRALTETPISLDKLKLVASRAMAKCDKVDGLADGLIDDPRKCDFDPARDVPELTHAEAAALKKVYGGVVSNGKPFFPGFMIASENNDGWANLIVPGQRGGNPADFSLADATMKYLVFNPPKPDWNYQTFDFDRDVTLVDRWGQLANAKNPDLSAFRKRGGKLMMTYGWADAILQPLMGVTYYENAVAKNGPQTAEFFRLFMVPGMAHCGGGVGPDQHDAVSAVIDWVEKGKAPDTLLAKKIVNGQVTRTRPLCPYPQVARYKGQGSIDDAANFRCTAP
ncbi:MAG TPA: tannase/feruloyl esterase family alpha/beta hydrolase [Vicinamibacterales bacterium]|nr:tannase/feruloyl esterase family alpha/beta hydrolase [Vicinamibacterales bacterium]